MGNVLSVDGSRVKRLTELEVEGLSVRIEFRSSDERGALIVKDVRDVINYFMKLLTNFHLILKAGANAMAISMS